MNICFSVIGDPIAKARPRAISVKGRTWVYTPKATRNYEEEIKKQSMQYKPEKPIEGPVSVGLKIFRKIPKSMSKKNKKLVEEGKLMPIQKPDLDNYIKTVTDALNGIFWIDDSQVISYLLGTGKYYSDNPRLEIEIVEI